MLKGKTALITGASRGIGRGIAVKFAKNGAFVGINYISNEKGAKETLKIIKEKGGDGILLRGDVSKSKDVENIVKTFIEKARNIDILVNNAGIYNRNYFDDISFEKLEMTHPLPGFSSGIYSFCRLCFIKGRNPWPNKKSCS